ncbi:uncharacterized protein ARMOST_19281 [Armillaria ostoyae]|uniref:Uncharacterized protein n=1 Tax=Armillaria ostoyae TaxID=47428 RepID=A0A284S473_ARMOS|nr:uncharacterized protein ARMOST_19281 [Armillaria ostoyae]
MNTLPPELVQQIIYDIWHSETPSWMRQSFMTTFPRINRTWNNVYAPIASRDIYITSLAHLYYLCDVACCQTSVIYGELIPRLTRTITCFVDRGQDSKTSGDRVANKMYDILIKLPNDVGFRALFPLVEFISFELRWIYHDRGTKYRPLEIRSLPRVRCHRYLYQSARMGEDARMEIHISITCDSWISGFSPCTFLALRDKGVPAKMLSSSSGPPYCRPDLFRSSEHYYQDAYVRQLKGDLKSINRRLCMTAERAHVPLRFRRLGGYFDHICRILKAAKGAHGTLA